MTYTDGRFIAPMELEGSGLRRFDEVSTMAFTVTRYYIQAAAYYSPLPLNTMDAVYTGAFLVSEQETQRVGGFVWFTREFYAPPLWRRESRQVTFTFPGQSGVNVTWQPAPNQNDLTVTEPVYSWNKFGSAPPSTKVVVATVEIDFTIGVPTLPKPTLITYDGAVVDFIGSVYKSGQNGIELEGSTDPISMPSEFIISAESSRVRGNIWKREVVKIGGNYAVSAH